MLALLQKTLDLWAVELKSSGKFIGFVGLHTPKPNLSFSPCVEIGWRLLKEFWGKGYATEAAQEALVYAFNTLKLNEVVSVYNNIKFSFTLRYGALGF